MDVPEGESNFCIFESPCIPGVAAAKAAKSRQLCPTLCDPIDGSPAGSTVPGILQARTLEWVAISFSNAWKWKVKVKSLSCVRPLATPWTAAFQAPLSMGFSRQEYWSGVPLPSPLTEYIPIENKKVKKNLLMMQKKVSQFWNEKVVLPSFLGSSKTASYSGWNLGENLGIILLSCGSEVLGDNKEPVVGLPWWSSG